MTKFEVIPPAEAKEGQCFLEQDPMSVRIKMQEASVYKRCYEKAEGEVGSWMSKVKGG